MFCVPKCALLGRYSKCLYQDPDPEPYQDPCSQYFNTDALSHVSVSVKRFFLFEPYVKLTTYHS